MDNFDAKKQFDNGNVESEGDILHLEDIMPGEVENKDQGAGKSGIPQFDLAETIMANQRKITSVRRKSPTGREDYKIEPLHIAHRTAEAQQPGDDIDHVIEEIVAKDIARLCEENGLKGV